MTPEEQQTAIAKASKGAIEFYEDVWRYFDGKRLQTCKDNDPLQDLNAMHEVEESCKEELANNLYFKKLSEICYRDWPNNRDQICATAAQRAEAFLKTLNPRES